MTSTRQRDTKPELLLRSRHARIVVVEFPDRVLVTNYLDLIVALVTEHGPVERRDVDEALVSKLPDRLTLEQKRRKIRNLLQELRRAGKIVNLGSRSRPRWSAQDKEAGE